MAENVGFAFPRPASPTKLLEAQDSNADSPQEWTLKAHSGSKIPRPSSAASTPVGQRIVAKVRAGGMGAQCCTCRQQLSLSAVDAAAAHHTATCPPFPHHCCPQTGSSTPLPTPNLAGLGPGSREDALKQIEADLEARLAREQAALASGAMLHLPRGALKLLPVAKSCKSRCALPHVAVHAVRSCACFHPLCRAPTLCRCSARWRCGPEARGDGRSFQSCSQQRPADLQGPLSASVSPPPVSSLSSHLALTPVPPILTPAQARIQELNNKLERTRDTYAKLVAANEAYAKSARKVASAERRLQDQEATARKASGLGTTAAVAMRSQAGCSPVSGGA